MIYRALIKISHGPSVFQACKQCSALGHLCKSSKTFQTYWIEPRKDQNISNGLSLEERLHKVENILEGSLDLIPSLKIMGGLVCLRCKGKTLLGVVNKLMKVKKIVDNAQQYFAFPAHNSNFHWRRRWWDQTQIIFLNLFYFITCGNLSEKYFAFLKLT